MIPDTFAADEIRFERPELFVIFCGKATELLREPVAFGLCVVLFTVVVACGVVGTVVGTVVVLSANDVNETFVVLFCCETLLVGGIVRIAVVFPAAVRDVERLLHLPITGVHPGAP